MMMSLHADAVVFDLDGVLVDSRRAFVRAVNGALAERGLAERGEDEILAVVGAPPRRAFRALGAEDDAEVDALVMSYRGRYADAIVGEAAVFDGVGEMLVALQDAVPLVIATAKPQGIAEQLLDALGLRGHFAAVHGPSIQARDEAKSLTIARALDGLPFARRAVMVGDRKFDVLGARAHELPCVGVLWGIGSEQELRDAGAAALARAPSELVALLG
jgi:phosphoglycolate phosphatase